MILYVTRHGETYHNMLNIIGGDSSLTQEGTEYSHFLKTYLDTNHPNTPITVWTSSLKRTKETVQFLNQGYIFREFPELDEIHSGDFENTSLIEIQEKYTSYYNEREKNKLNNSYPNGESYKDVYKRVKNMLEENFNFIETNVVLIVAHQAVCRILHACLTDITLQDCVNMEIKLHTLYVIA